MLSSISNIATQMMLKLNPNMLIHETNNFFFVAGCGRHRTFVLHANVDDHKEGAGVSCHVNATYFYIHNHHILVHFRGSN